MRGLALALALLVAACDETGTTWYDTSVDPMPDAALDTLVDPAADVPGDLADTAPPDSPADTAEDEPAPTGVCDRYNADMADASEGEWSGDVDTCDPGDMSAGWRERALKVTNLVRWLAGMPPSALDTSSNAALQECALMMTANRSLNHSPPSTWDCYGSAGAGAAGSSNLAMGAAVGAVGSYMNDQGNTSTYGHRRWILGHGLDTVGFGSTDRYSCMLVLHMPGGSDPPWIGWPPPGEFPYEARSWLGRHWTIQSNAIDLTGAAATVTRDGTPLEIETWDLAPGYGSASAIAFTPRGTIFSVSAGETYHIEVPSASISFDVRIVDCGT
jgi:hypothetical protein